MIVKSIYFTAGGRFISINRLTSEWLIWCESPTCYSLWHLTKDVYLSKLWGVTKTLRQALEILSRHVDVSNRRRWLAEVGSQVDRAVEEWECRKSKRRKRSQLADGGSLKPQRRVNYSGPSIAGVEIA